MLSTGSDRPIADFSSAFCRPPYALTQEMVALYVFAMVRTGAWEIVLNQAAACPDNYGQTTRRKPPYRPYFGFVKWNTQLDKALLGARVVVSTQKGWNEILPFARVLDDSLKPAASRTRTATQRTVARDLEQVKS